MQSDWIAVIDQRDRLWARVLTLTHERQHIAQTLRTFAEAPVTIASLQPVLRLAADLNLNPDPPSVSAGERPTQEG